MNVSPVTAPGPTTPGVATATVGSRQASTSGADRGGVRERSVVPATLRDDGQINAVSDQTNQGELADRKMAEQLKTFINDENMRLRTYHDESSGRSILEVRDQTTGRVVSQYPSEELIRLYASLRETLIDQHA